MDPIASKPQVTSLLSNQLLSAVERLRLGGSRRFTNRARGEHLSAKGGSSNEFADYRDYVEGDDVRFVDWNIFARIQRPYLKLYRHEEEMHVVLLIDASASMAFEGKLDLARQAAAALGVMGLFGSEKVSAYAFNQKDKHAACLKPCTGRGNLHKLFRHLEAIEPGGDAPAEAGVDDMLKQHRGRGVVVLLSDFLTFGDLRKAFNLLYSAGLEIFALQILAPVEFDPLINGDLRLEDCEDQSTLDITAGGDLLAIYREYFTAFQNRLESLATQRGGRFLSTPSNTPVDQLVLDQMRRKGWIR